VFAAINKMCKTVNELGCQLAKSTPNQNFSSNVVAIQTNGSSVVDMQQIYYNEHTTAECFSHTEGFKMSDEGNYTLHFVGWCFNAAKNNDKIWGFFEMNNAPAPDPKRPWEKKRGSLYNFWGKRGKTLTFQRHYGEWGGGTDLESLQRNKARVKGYKEYSSGRLNELVPDFKDYLAQQFVMAKFSGKVKDDDMEEHSFV
jgi:hypothetical protein